MLFMLLEASNLCSAPITLSYLLETTTLPVCEQLRSAALHVLLKSSPLLPRVWHVHVCELQAARRGCGWLGASASAALHGS